MIDQRNQNNVDNLYKNWFIDLNANYSIITGKSSTPYDNLLVSAGELREKPLDEINTAGRSYSCSLHPRHTPNEIGRPTIQPSRQSRFHFPDPCQSLKPG